MTLDTRIFANWVVEEIEGQSPCNAHAETPVQISMSGDSPGASIT